MKPINIPEEKVTELFGQFIEKFRESINDFPFNENETITLKTNLSAVAKEKVKLVYSQEAYLRMLALVNHFSTEVAWYGLCKRLSEKEFYIYDVLVCKQYVNGAKVDTEDEDTLEFFNNLTDDEAEHMHFQAHSHVNMSTGASGTDMQNQQDVVKNMGKSGFYIFQIWNKSGDINTYLYDLDNNVYYDRKDVDIIIEDSMGSIDDYISSIKDLVITKTVYPYQNWKNWNNQNNYPAKTTKKKEKEMEEIADMTDEEFVEYYQNYYQYGRWDW